MHYTLQTAKAKDKTGLMRVLPILANSVKGHPFEDPFMHCLVTSLIQVCVSRQSFREFTDLELEFLPEVSSPLIVPVVMCALLIIGEADEGGKS